MTGVKKTCYSKWMCIYDGFICDTFVIVVLNLVNIAITKFVLDRLCDDHVTYDCALGSTKLCFKLCWWMFMSYVSIASSKIFVRLMQILMLKQD